MENEEQTIEAGAAGAPEGTPAVEPTADEIAELYKATGVKAPVPTGKAKGRPKSDTVRAKDDDKKDAGDSKDGKQGNGDGKSKPKDAPSDAKDGGAGDGADEEGSEDGKGAGKVQGKPDEADKGVRDAESQAEKDTKRGSEANSDEGADGAGQKPDESGDEAEEGEDAEKGKRPGKSAPEVEKRFQKLTQEKRERDEIIADLQKKLQEKEQLVEKTKIAAEDPEYTIEDFAKVRNEDGEILDLDKNQAELAWRRWKDGYDERTARREAAANKAADEAAAEEKSTRDLMEKSVAAYDALAALQDEFPELVSDSGKFNADFAAKAMPIIKEAMQYLEGTEPGNAEGNKPVVIGLKINPKIILSALKSINDEKRSLPLNGTRDNVETRSNVAVPHSRSSDPTIQAANELMKELNINKRF